MTLAGSGWFFGFRKSYAMVPKTEPDPSKNTRLELDRQQIVNHFAVDVGQAAMDAVVIEGKTLVIESK